MNLAKPFKIISKCYFKCCFMPWLSQMQKLEQTTVKYTALAYCYQSCVGGSTILYQLFQDAVSCHFSSTWSVIAFLVQSFAYSFSALSILLTAFLLIGSRDRLDLLVLNFSVSSHLQEGQDGKIMNDFEERDNIMLEGIYCIGYFWLPRQISRQSRQGKYLSRPILEDPDLTEPFSQPVQTLTSSNQALLQIMKYCLSISNFLQKKNMMFFRTLLMDPDSKPQILTFIIS